MTLTARGRAVAAILVGLLAGFLGAASVWPGYLLGQFDWVKVACIGVGAAVVSGILTSRALAPHGAVTGE